MRLITRISTFSLILLFSANILAQNKKYVQAYQTYNAGEYFKSIDLFKEAYESITDKEEKAKIVFHIAECYRKTDQPRKAQLWYSKAIKKDYSDPVAYLHYANMLKMNGEYDEAKAQFQAYKKLVPSDPRADDGIQSCSLAKEWMDYPSGYTVEEMRFINSKLDDFSPTFAREDFRVLYFTSAREETTGNDEHGVSGQGFSDIFETTVDLKGKWSSPVPLSDAINTEYDDGAPVLNQDFTRLYFTRCLKRANKTSGCGIYVSQLKNGEWENAKELEIESDTLVVAHPAISKDELTLYFVSDMEGSMVGTDGKPSLDIWMVTRNSIGDDFGSPVNMGEPINTSDDEAFPYVHADGSFYFASNGHVGMGGYDIYKATKDESGSWKIENMRYPVNSSGDDFGITFESGREAGFFSSSRTGRSDDIYTFLLPPLKFSITGIIKDEKTNEPIEGAKVKSVGSDGITLETTTDTEGEFKFMLKPGTDYLFIAKKENYLQGKERETTKSQETSMDFSTEIYLSPIDKPISIENIFFDFDSDVLRPESMVSLDKLVETLNDNPNIIIELGSHTDSRGDEDYNNELSQARAQSVVNYLISKGIAQERLVPKGYGESKPKIVDTRDHEAYPFLQEGQQLTESFIKTIEDDDLKEVALFLNRRTEFFVLSTDYQKE